MKKYSIKQCAVVLQELTVGLTGKKLDQAMQAFLEFLIKNNKTSQAERIISAFQTIDDEKNNRVRATVATAYELSTADEKKIKEQLMSLTKKDVVVEQVLDTSLVGGFKVTINDTVYNASLQGALMNLQKQLSL